MEFFIKLVTNDEETVSVLNQLGGKRPYFIAMAIKKYAQTPEGKDLLQVLSSSVGRRGRKPKDTMRETVREDKVSVRVGEESQPEREVEMETPQVEARERKKYDVDDFKL